MAIPSYVDGIMVRSSTTGTGVSMTLTTAVDGYRGHAVATNGALYNYSIRDSAGAYEHGQGVYSSAGTLQRTTIFSSSNGGSRINLTGNQFVVFGQMLSQDLANFAGFSAAGAALVAGAIGTLAGIAAAGAIAAGNFLYTTGADTWAAAPISAVGRTLVAQSTQALMRTTGLGMSADASTFVAAADNAAMRTALGVPAAASGTHTGTASFVAATFSGGYTSTRADGLNTAFHTGTSKAIRLRPSSSVFEIAGVDNTGVAYAPFQINGSELWFAASGTVVWKMSTTGHFLAATDNTNDIGASGATRFRDFYLARNAVIGGTLALGGALTYGGVGLSNSVTGTTSMVLASSPTITTPTFTNGFTASGTGPAEFTNNSTATPSVASSRVIIRNSSSNVNQLIFINTNAAVDNRTFYFQNNGTSFVLNALNDAANATAEVFSVARSGTAISSFKLTTHFLATTDNTYDLGASGATRFRDFFLARNAVIGGTLAVTGVSTLTGKATFPGGLSTASSSGTAMPTATATTIYTCTVTDHWVEVYFFTRSAGGGGVFGVRGTVARSLDVGLVIVSQTAFGSATATLSISGGNIQVTQTSGGNKDWYAEILKVGS